MKGALGTGDLHMVVIQLYGPIRVCGRCSPAFLIARDVSDVRGAVAVMAAV